MVNAQQANAFIVSLRRLPQRGTRQLTVDFLAHWSDLPKSVVQELIDKAPLEPSNAKGPNPPSKPWWAKRTLKRSANDGRLFKLAERLAQEAAATEQKRTHRTKKFRSPDGQLNLKLPD